MKNNNRGFSLVELVVVIAIMAVLVGVLAPMFIQYVERSRMAVDIQTVDLLCHTVETFAADVNTHHITIPDGDTITIKHGTVPVDTSSGNYWQLSLENAGIQEYGLRSTRWFADGTEEIVITVSNLNGTPVFSESGLDPDLSLLKGDYVK